MSQGASATVDESTPISATVEAHPTDEVGRRRSILRKTATVLVVIILIISLAAVLSPPTGDEGPSPDGEGPPWVDPKPVVIDEDTSWSDRRGVLLDRPTVVASGAALTIERCNLTVDLLDLVMGNASWLSVEPGASLTIRDTRISITYDQRLEDAVFVPYSQPTKGAYSLSRAVNLNGTADPRLTLDLLWWAMETTLVVGVQRQPRAPLETIASLEPPNDEERGWHHYEIPLSAFKGTVVRIVLFPSDGWGARNLLVGKMLVTDGERTPLWDELRTGRAWEDLWLMRGFTPFFKEFLGTYTRYSPLIEAQGNVRIAGSILEAPAGLPRGNSRIAASKFDLANLLPGRGGAVSEVRAPTLGHVMMRGGSLSIERSSLLNVPIIATDSELDVRDSSLSGDATPLSVASTWGLINATDLEVHPFTPVCSETPSDSRDGIAVLAAHFNSSSGPLRVRGCDLTGGGRGLDLNHAWAEVEGCAFDGQGWMALWDHSSRGIGSWEEVLRSNTFDDLDGYAFLRTHNALLDLTGPGRPAPGGSGYFTGLISWLGQEGYYDWQVLTRIDILTGHLLMPTELVDASMGVNRIDEVSLDLYTSWGGIEGLRIHTSVATLTVVLDPSLAFGDGGSYYKTAFMRVEEAPGPSPGQVNLTVHVRIPADYIDDWWIEIVDAEDLLRTLTPEEALEDPYSNYNGMFLATVDVGPGLHVMAVEVHGMAGKGDELLTSWSRDYLRVTGTGNGSLVRPFLGVGGGVLMLDPNVTVEVAGVTSLDDGVEALVVMAFLSTGARLGLSGIALPPAISTRLQPSGPGTFEVTNLTVGSTVLIANECRLRISNMTTADLALEMTGCQGIMDNITTGTLRSLTAYNGCSLVAEDLTLESQEDEIYGWIMNSNLTLRRMSVISDNGSFMGLSTQENGSLTIESSTFHDCVLDIWSYYMNNMTLSIADCDFQGEASGLKISWDPGWESSERAFLNGSSVEGNRFHGGDLVCPPAIADLYIGNNMLGPGSRYIMWFYGYVDTEGMPENATQVRSYIDSDEPSSELGRNALGRFYDQWSGLFVEGSLAPPHFTDEPVVHYYFVAEVSSYQGKWVFDFASVPLTPSGEPIKVLEWDDVTGLVLPLVRP